MSFDQVRLNVISPEIRKYFATYLCGSFATLGKWMIGYDVGGIPLSQECIFFRRFSRQPKWNCQTASTFESSYYSQSRPRIDASYGPADFLQTGSSRLSISGPGSTVSSAKLVNISHMVGAATQKTVTVMGKNVNAKVALLKMHEIDSLYDKIRRRLLLLTKAAEGSTELDALREEVESIDLELQNTRTEQQDLELESRSLTDRIREQEKTLMSGELHNPKELEALQSSIDTMKSHRTDLENRSVDRLVMVDSLQVSMEEKQAALAKVEEEWTSRKTAFETEIDKRKKEYVYLKKAREHVAEILSTENLELYEHLRRRKNGVAVAQLEDEMCGACHTQVAIGILNNIRYSDELLSCPSCGRILLTQA